MVEPADSRPGVPEKIFAVDRKGKREFRRSLCAAPRRDLEPCRTSWRPAVHAPQHRVRRARSWRERRSPQGLSPVRRGSVSSDEAARRPDEPAAGHRTGPSGRDDLRIMVPRRRGSRARQNAIIWEEGGGTGRTLKGGADTCREFPKIGLLNSLFLSRQFSCRTPPLKALRYLARADFLSRKDFPHRPGSRFRQARMLYAAEYAAPELHRP